MTTYKVVTEDGTKVLPGMTLVARGKGGPRPLEYVFSGVVLPLGPNRRPHVTVTHSDESFDYLPVNFGLTVVALPGPCWHGNCALVVCDDVHHTDSDGQTWSQSERAAWCTKHDRFCLPFCIDAGEAV